MRIKFGQHTIDVSERLLLVGILNVSPDSVADTHATTDPERAIARGVELWRAGADIVEVGGQSGRTDTDQISVDEEITRVVPVVKGLAEQGIKVGIDTWRAEVAAAAISAGACLVNDSGGMVDRDMPSVVADGDASLVVMETPVRPKERGFPGYTDVVQQVCDALRSGTERALACGVPRDRLLIDPGLDYGKTPSESLVILRHLDEIARLGFPIFLAVSRKYFVGVITDTGPLDRLGGTLAALAWGFSKGARVARVHDVKEAWQAARMVEALLWNRGQLDDPYPDERLMWLPATHG